MMRSFNKTAAQGEIYIRKIDKIPEGCKPVSATNGRVIVGHSETGHHHTLCAAHADVVEAVSAPAGMRILYAIVSEQTALDHERSFDTHEPIGLQPGMYEFRIGREYDPYEEIARRQAD